jgi:ribosomal protein L37AE/L43A
MNIKELKMILETKTCPKCGLGMVTESSKGVYQCTLSRCGEVFDFSAYSDMSLEDIAAASLKQ